MLKKILNFYYQKIRYKLRISSEPYLSGDTLRKYSDHILDESKKFNFDLVKNNDLIFVKTDYLELFFNTYYPKINNKIKLITHNSDIEINKENTEEFNFQKDSWFAQNVNFQSDNVFQVPIGLENRNFLNNGLLSHFKNLNTKKLKGNKILCSFSEDTNYERTYIKKLISQNINFDTKKFSNHKQYIQNLSQYKFNLCPSGNGLDTHRFWESIIAKCLPIVINSDFIMNFFRQEVPMYIIEDWDDLLALNFDELNYVYNKHFQSDNYLKFVNIEYWLEIIRGS